MLTYHAIIITASTIETTWRCCHNRCLLQLLLLLLLLLSLSLSLSFSPSFIEAFGATSTNNGIVATTKTTTHTHNRVAAFYATTTTRSCIDKYHIISRFKSSGGSGSCFSCTCNKPHHSSLTLSSMLLSSRPTTTSIGVSSCLLLLNSKKTAISDDAVGDDVRCNTVNDNNNNNDNSNYEACSKTEDYQNPIGTFSNIGNNCPPTKSKTGSSNQSFTMGRSAVTMGLVTVIVLGGLDYMVPTTAAAATAATSDDIKELKELIVEITMKSDQNAIKSDQQFNEINKSINENTNKSEERFNRIEKDFGYVPTAAVLASAIINALAIAFVQFMTDKSIRSSENAFAEKVRTSENAFTEKVDRTKKSFFRSSVIVSMGTAIIVVFGFAMSKQV